MGSPIWRITNSTAKLSQGRFSATADLARPFDGLSSVEPFFPSADVGRIFQIVLPDATAAGLPFKDAYVRANDLIVTYGQTESRPFSVQICWRALAEVADERIQAGIEVVVSSHTSLLDSRPIVTSRSELPSREVFQLRDIEAASFERIDIGDAHLQPQKFGPQSGAGCFVFRLPDSATSYVEMIHPLDFERSTFTAGADHSRRTIEHSLISRWMEKGVIVRSRMRGFFVVRSDDLATAATAYAAFCDSKLPLSA